MFDRLKAKLELLFYSEDIFKESREWIKEVGQKEGYSIEDRAYHFFIVNRMSFSGNGSSFGKNMIIRRNTSKSVSDLFTAIDGLFEIHGKIQNFIVTNRDAVELIRDYDNSKYFFYLDPPYHHDTRTAYRYPVDMSNDQQESFVYSIVNGKSKYLISAYRCDLYDEVLVGNGWNRVEFTVNTVTGTNIPKQKIECLYYNYNL
jgi:DNA adenine methylase